ncbi:hypothetical protein [Bacillus cereus group sp. BfR-BA-01451]|uniref:hypothetical protein n=1 Tax=Bacillus cereus group sp. BfR-BA-01451 TaxID=2920354 RepID=UPI001F573BCF|nr:hypothetical protein [Bacillus cereus group sp. BfR-BA-01451]
MKPVQIYLGVPQTDKLQVYDVKPGKQVTIKQMILTNTDVEAAKLTVTVNTIDIMKGIVVNSGETKFLDLTVVLNENNTLSLQQEKTNAINVMISGTEESTTVSSNY